MRRAVCGSVLAGLLLAGCGLLLPSARRPLHTPEREVEAACRLVPLPGVEDVAADRTGRLYLSSADRRRIFHPAPAEGRRPAVSGLYRLAPGGTPERLSQTDEDFYPHGLDLLPGVGQRPDRLFVVNHPLRPAEDPSRWDRCQPDSWIERYDLDGGTLIPAEPRRLAFDGEPRTSYNDVAATGPDTFYATGDTAALSCNGRLADLLLGRRTGRVLAYHTGRWSTVADGIGFANGIALDRKRGRLYVAAMQEGAIRVYRWNPAEPLAPLPLDAVIPLGTGVDNITMPDEDTLLVAAHPNLFSFARYWFDGGWRPPAQVLRLVLPREKRGDDWVFDPLPETPTVILDEDGRASSAVSVALVPSGAPEMLVLGSVFAPEFQVLQAVASDLGGRTRIRPLCAP